MKFFILAHSKLSYICVKNLILKNYIPEFVVIHNNYNDEELRDEFISPMENLCFKRDIKLYKVNSAEEVKEKVSSNEIGLCIGFMEILGKDFFNLPKHGILNLHCGKLPEYRGRAPICRSIMNDEKYLTISLHKIDEAIDSGDLCSELEIEIKDEDNVNTLYEKCSQLSSELVIDSLNKLHGGALKLTPQKISNKSNRVISQAERKIDWHNNARKIFNLVRAITLPYPSAFAIYNGKIYNIIDSEIIKGDMTNAKPGTILEVDKNYLKVKCADEALKIIRTLDKDFKEIDFLKTFIRGHVLE